MLTQEQRDVLADQYLRLNPVRLLAQINQALEQLWAMATTTSSHEPSVTSSIEATYALRLQFLLRQYVRWTPSIGQDRGDIQQDCRHQAVRKPVEELLTTMASVVDSFHVLELEEISPMSHAC